MSFNVDNSGLSDFIAKLEAVQNAVPEAVDEALDQLAEEVIEMLSEAAPFDPAENNGVIPGEEGHLAESFFADAADNGKVEVKTTEPIKFSYVTEGTDSPILPKTMQAMWWPNAPHPMAQVSGQEANPFHKALLPDIEERGELIIQEAINSLMQDL